MLAGDPMAAAANSGGIDLDAPLRSVRRRPPLYKSDLSSGPVRHPGTVPFLWERLPGQPKTLPSSSVAPAATSVRTRRPRPVPFPPPASEDVAALAEPAPSPGPSPIAGSAAVEMEPPPATTGTSTEPREEEEEGETFCDALDTLSTTEAFAAVDCSVVGGVGDGPNSKSAAAAAGDVAPAEVAEPGNGEEEARGFMIDRFLPAACAVAVGSPQYTFRKPSPREFPPAPVDARLPRRSPVQLPHQHLPPNYVPPLPKFGNYAGADSPKTLPDEEEDEDDGDDDDEYNLGGARLFTSRGCGFLPKLCIKSSKLLLLNTVPGTKDRSRDKGLPPRGNGRNRRSGSPLIRSSGDGSIACDSNEHSWDEVYKHKLEQKGPPLPLWEADGRSKLTSESNHLTSWSDSPSKLTDGSSPFQRSVCEAASPFHSEDAASPSHEDVDSFPRDSSQRASAIRMTYDATSAAELSQSGSHPSSDGQTFERIKVGDVKRLQDDILDGNDNVANKATIPLLHIMPLPLPQSPSESWLSRTLPSVTLSRNPIPPQPSRPQAPAPVALKKAGGNVKPSRPRQIRFAEVIEKPSSVREI